MINYNDNYDVPKTDNEYYDAYDGDYTESTTNLMDASTEMPKEVAGGKMHFFALLCTPLHSHALPVGSAFYPCTHSQLGVGSA